MKIFEPSFDILPESQKALWLDLSPCKDLGFVLYGGTAIALQIGHRASIYFDFFSHPTVQDFLLGMETGVVVYYATG